MRGGLSVSTGAGRLWQAKRQGLAPGGQAALVPLQDSGLSQMPFAARQTFVPSKYDFTHSPDTHLRSSRQGSAVTLTASQPAGLVPFATYLSAGQRGPGDERQQQQ